MANATITTLLAILAVAMATGAYGQAPGEHCHTSAYNVDCGVVKAAKAALIGGTCNVGGQVKIVSAFAPANGCGCTVKQTAPTKAVFDAYDTCEHAQPAYAPLKGQTCPAGKTDGPCA